MSRVETDGPALDGTILTVLDTAAKDAATRAAALAQQELRDEAPQGPTRKLRENLVGRATKTATGYTVTVGVKRAAMHDQNVTVAQVARWVQRGTGLRRRGPGPKAPIHAKHHRLGRRMVLPGGKRRWKVKGQHPNPFMQRAKARLDPRVADIIRDAASRAADKQLRGR